MFRKYFPPYQPWTTGGCVHCVCWQKGVCAINSLSLKLFHILFAATFPLALHRSKQSTRSPARLDRCLPKAYLSLTDYSNASRSGKWRFSMPFFETTAGQTYIINGNGIDRKTTFGPNGPIEDRMVFPEECGSIANKVENTCYAIAYCNIYSFWAACLSFRKQNTEDLETIFVALLGGSTVPLLNYSTCQMGQIRLIRICDDHIVRSNVFFSVVGFVRVWTVDIVDVTWQACCSILSFDLFIVYSIYSSIGTVKFSM